MVNFENLIRKEVLANPDWNVVYECEVKAYYLDYKHCFGKHIHAPGITDGGFWFHEHVTSEEGMGALNYRTERKWDTLEGISGYVKKLDLPAPSEHLLELISQANMQNSRRKQQE